MRRQPRIFHLTSGEDDYTRCFVAALRQQGLDAVHADWSGFRLLRQCSRGDVVHLHWPSFLYQDPQSRFRSWRDLAKLMIVLTMLRLSGSQIVWTAHNLYPHEGGACLLNRVARRFIVRIASAICVHGEAARQEVSREFDAWDKRFIPLQLGHWIGYYENSVTRETARARLGVSEKTFLFLFVGLCRPYKNLIGLCAAFRQLPDRCQLLVAGHFPDPVHRAEVGSAADGDPRIVIRDQFVPSNELQYYMNACDAVVLPYSQILTSGAVMLALSFGKPVVAADFPFLREVVTPDCGVLFDSGDPAGLADAMSRVKSTSFDTGKILARAREFDWHSSAASYLQALAEMNVIQPSRHAVLRRASSPLVRGLGALSRR